MVKIKGKLSKSGLAIGLSTVRGFSDPKVRAEQYMTDSEIGATVLWDAYMRREINGKVIADLGSGTGILGIGAMLLGASKVYFVESDSLAMGIAKDNVENVESESSSEFFLGDVTEFKEKVDVVVMNPPFGVKSEHSDRKFLEKAFEISEVVYSFHKSETKEFIEKFSSKHNFKITQILDFLYPLKSTMKFHKKRIERINVSCFRLVKQN